MSYSLISGPETMSISPSGEVSWMPTLADVGAHTVVIRATDPAGVFTEQSFVLSVENERPVFLTEPPTSVRAGGSVLTAAERALDLPGLVTAFGQFRPGLGR